jgi:hypothetical protein
MEFEKPRKTRGFSFSGISIGDLSAPRSQECWENARRHGYLSTAQPQS